MLRMTKWIAPAIALAFVAMISSRMVSAQEATTQPDAKVTVKVLAADGTPAVGATVQVRAATTRPAGGGAGAAAGGGRRGGPPLASGTTDDKGMATLSFPDTNHGEYALSARTTTPRGRGRQAITLGADHTADVTLSLTAGRAAGGNGGGGGGNGGGAAPATPGANGGAGN
ncbi:MAG: hypothetical protein M3O30_11385 [Planctomycetota bacterium]|nr:hypothetical protein [Planctomycetota bacterium]